MMSIEYIQQLAKEAGVTARQRGVEPYLIESKDEMLAFVPHTNQEFPFPNLGSYCPKGWRRVDRAFVDSSGFGSDNEPSMTVRRFSDWVEPGFGYAVVECGQFQVYVGKFKKVVKKERKEKVTA